MEFNEKLQELRKQKGLTQEELAALLYVSRTAVSKWESGRGYPNIESLKALAKLFSVTVDTLLSGDELLTIAEEDNKQRQKHVRDLVYGLLDVSVAILLFLPFFAQKTDVAVQAVSLLSLTTIASYMRVAYFVVIAGIVVTGIVTLALQSSQCVFWLLIKYKISLVLSLLAVILFVLSPHPYAAMLVLVFLVIKALILIKIQ